MRVRIDSRTDHHHNVQPHVNGLDFRKGPTFDGWFTTKRTRQRAVCVGKVHATIAKGQRVYLVTLTHGRWAPDRRSPMEPRKEFNGYRRREALRLFLDNLRKVPGYGGHLWTTERHKSGALHHHVVVRFSSAWCWRKVVQRWSWRYCGSGNGLDIVEVDRGDGHKVSAYVAKVLGYCSKGFGKDEGTPVPDQFMGQTIKRFVDESTGELTDGAWDALPFRWWGTSKVVRHWEEPSDEVPPFVPSDHVRGRTVTGKVPDEYAIAGASRRTRAVELDRLKRLKLHRALVKEAAELRKAIRVHKRWWKNRVGAERDGPRTLRHTFKPTASP